MGLRAVYRLFRSFGTFITESECKLECKRKRNVVNIADQVALRGS